MKRGVSIRIVIKIRLMGSEQTQEKLKIDTSIIMAYLVENENMLIGFSLGRA